MTITVEELVNNLVDCGNNAVIKITTAGAGDEYKILSIYPDDEEEIVWIDIQNAGEYDNFPLEIPFEPIVWPEIPINTRIGLQLRAIKGKTVDYGSLVADFWVEINVFQYLTLYQKELNIFIGPIVQRTENCYLVAIGKNEKVILKHESQR